MAERRSALPTDTRTRADVWELATTNGPARRSCGCFGWARILAGPAHRAAADPGRVLGAAASGRPAVGWPASWLSGGLLRRHVFSWTWTVAGHSSAGDVVLTVVLAAQVNHRSLVGHADRGSSSGPPVRSPTPAGSSSWRTSPSTPGAPSTTSVQLPGRLTYGIHLRGLGYRYPHGTDRRTARRRPAPAGRLTVALVGENGAGRPRWSSCSPASTSRPRAGSRSTASTSPPWTRDRWRRGCRRAFQDFRALRVPRTADRRGRRPAAVDDQRRWRPRWIGPAAGDVPAAPAGRAGHPARRPVAGRSRPVRRAVAEARARPRH